MSFAGLKQGAAEADESERRASEQEVLARALATEKFAEDAVAAAEAGAGADPRARKFTVMRMEAGLDCDVPRTVPGPMGFGVDWDPLQPHDLRGRARATYDLLVLRREALPEGERFDIKLHSYPLGHGSVLGWELAIVITW